MRHSRSFAREPASVSAARRFASQAVSGAAADVVGAVELMVSELATNCVRHSGTPFELVVTKDRGQIRVEVTDRAGGTPQMRSPGPEDPTGRGLQIVNMLAQRWGVEPQRPRGKTVWFTIGACTAPA